MNTGRPRYAQSSSSSSYGGGLNTSSQHTTTQRSTLGDSLSRVAREWEATKGRETLSLRTRIATLEDEKQELQDDLAELKDQLAESANEAKKLATDKELAEHKVAEATALLKMERSRFLGAALLISELAKEVPAAEVARGPQQQHHHQQQQLQEDEDEDYSLVVVDEDDEDENEEGEATNDNDDAALAAAAAAAGAGVSPKKKKKRKKKKKANSNNINNTATEKVHLEVAAAAAAVEAYRVQRAAAVAAAESVAVGARALVEGARDGELGFLVRSVGGKPPTKGGGDAHHSTVVLQDAAECVLSAALDAASRNGHLRACKVLIDAGASAERACGLAADDALVLNTATAQTAAWPATALASAGPQQQQLQRSVTKPMMNHVGGAAVVDLLVDAAALGAAPTLHAAIASGHDDVAKLLLRGGANANYAAAALNGATPLHTAAAHNRADLARHLIAKCNARIDAVDNAGRSASTIAGERRWARVGAVLNDPSLLFWARANKANRLCKEGEHELALESFEHALAELKRMQPKPSKPNVATLHHNRAKSLQALGRALAARVALNEALDLHDDGFHASSLEKRAECHAALFEHARAAEDLKTLQDRATEATEAAKVADWKRREGLERAKATMPPREILGLPKTGLLDAASVRAAYRRLSIKWHPDRHAAHSAEARHRAHLHFQRINAAHETLRAQAQLHTAHRARPTYRDTSAWPPPPGHDQGQDDDDGDPFDADVTDDDDDDGEQDDYIAKWRTYFNSKAAGA